MADYLRETHHEFLAASDAALGDARLQQILGQLGDTLGRRNREAWAAGDEAALVPHPAPLDGAVGDAERALVTFVAGDVTLRKAD